MEYLIIFLCISTVTLFSSTVYLSYKLYKICSQQYSVIDENTPISSNINI